MILPVILSDLSAGRSHAESESKDLALPEPHPQTLKAWL
jgi:hypothetical protein